jgi:hypothetical protein
VELKRLFKKLLAAQIKPQMRRFWGQYYEMKATAGQSSTSMCKGGKETEKLFLLSKTTTEPSLRTLLKKLIS